MTPAERATVRIREEMAARNLSQIDLAEALHCSQGRITKMLNNRVELRLDDVARLAEAVGIPLTEAIRDRGLEFYAEMTPTEVRILERLRQRPDTAHALLTVLNVQVPASKKGRRDLRPIASATNRRKRGRPKNSESDNHR